jgi:enoyl reductase
MSKALVFTEHGGPEVLTVIEVVVPKPGPKQIRVRVKAAGVQPFDCLFRSGAARQWVPAAFPQRLGNEFAGVIDAVGEGVTAVSVGDEVIGWAILGSIAEHVVVSTSDVVAKPANMPWPEAGALSASGQTASTALDRLRVGDGDTVLIHAAAGGVGSFAVQIAKARGAAVVGTASEKNHDYLRSLGATPVLYGNGLVQRIRVVAPHGVDAALVAVGSDEALHASLELTRDKTRIGTVAFQPLAEKLGVARLSTERSASRLGTLTKLYAEGKLRISIQQTYRLEEAADAHRLVEAGHVRGKIAFVA